MQNFCSAAMFRRNILLSVIMVGALVLSACGFHLRGVADLSFSNLYIQGSKLSISKDLNRSLKGNGIQIVEKAEDAEVLLELMGEGYQKRILSLSGGGLVREFELNYRVTFRTRSQGSPLWGAVQTVQSRRDFSYNDNALLAKGEEEARLNTDMRNDAIREIIRRLSATKPAAR